MTYDRSAVMRAVKSRDTGLSDDYRLTVIARRRETPVAELACRRELNSVEGHAAAKKSKSE